MLNTKIYLAEFQDGSTNDYAANVIAEAIYDQVKGDGYNSTLFDAIIGHEYVDSADLIPKDSEENNLKTVMNIWKICLSWKDGSSSWHPMNEIKNSYPIQLAGYVIKNNLQDQPAFKPRGQTNMRSS